MKRLFSGGIHPADKKELTCNKPVVFLQAPDYVYIPLQQHIGAPCKPLVSVGDYVRMGEKIGDGEGLCVPIHASVSGRVESIEPRLHPNGTMVQTITIKNDGMDTKCENRSRCANPESLSSEELFEIIREAGIVGMGGATFSTEIKALSSLNKVDTLIINACECEPYITSDDVLLKTDIKSVLQGIRLMAKALKVEKVFLAIEENKENAIKRVLESISCFSEIRIKILSTRYPQGAEKQLILAVTGRELPAGKLPSDVRCAVFNAATVSAVAHAVLQGEPLIQRIVTVTGEGVNEPTNFMVRVGTPFSKLIEAAGGLKESADRVILGGPMMGMAQSDLAVPVIKGTGAILCLETQKKHEDVMCIRCGKCVGACPMHLEPLYLYRYQLSNQIKMLEQFHLMDCMECGCCAYICPGKLPLVEHFRLGKRTLKEGKG